MAWKLREEPKVVIASKPLIEEFRTMATLPSDRPFKQSRLDHYKKIRAAGEFRSATWASCLCVENNTVYRMNGNHTSLMLAEEEPLGKFHVILERYMADTLTDCASLYNTFDSKLGMRSNADINKTFASAIPEARDLPIKKINLAITALAFKKWGPKVIRVSANEKAEELLEGWPFAVWLNDMLKTNTTKKAATTSDISPYMLRSPVTNAMYVTYLKSPAKAAEFWALVRDGNHPEVNHVTRMLNRFLVVAVLGGGQKARFSSAQTIVDGDELYAKCIYAWNSWRNNTPTKLAYYPNKPLPEPV